MEAGNHYNLDSPSHVVNYYCKYGVFIHSFFMYTSLSFCIRLFIFYPSLYFLTLFVSNGVSSSPQFSSQFLLKTSPFFIVRSWQQCSQKKGSHTSDVMEISFHFISYLLILMSGKGRDIISLKCCSPPPPPPFPFK